MMSIWEAGFYFAGCVALMGVMAVYNLGLRLPRWPRRMGTPLPRALARAALPEPEVPSGTPLVNPEALITESEHCRIRAPGRHDADHLCDLLRQAAEHHRRRFAHGFIPTAIASEPRPPKGGSGVVLPAADPRYQSTLLR